ncbi:hypothetical protein [Priestia megaterium]|uniref:hypothetical protein n=1 Tax=Priestia megaterium TaxID=1404 RepID=UPI0018669215|nr:hypothetical protein [Priestia megaterium]MBE2973397.1 hypothetical protein [Priestia megaterium]
MPNIGDRETVNAVRVSADATGGYGTTKTSNDSQTYVPPDGYVIINHEVEENRAKGDRTLSVGYEESAEIKTKIEEQKSRLEGEAKGMLTEVYGEGNFQGELDQVKTIIESHTVRPVVLVVKAHAKGHPRGEADNHSYIEANIKAEIMYVGNNVQSIVDAVKHLKGS